MKRILFILTALFLFTFVSANTSNAAVIVKQNIEYLPDGSYYETTITTKEDIRFLWGVQLQHHVLEIKQQLIPQVREPNYGP